MTLKKLPRNVMPQLKQFLALSVFFLISGCSMFRYSDDPNYTICKNMQSQIQFGTSSAYNRFGNISYTEAAKGPDELERRRLQATYDKLNCNQYQWLKF